MKFSFGRGGGQISLNKKISQNKVSYIGLKYLIPDGRVQNPKFVIFTTPYLKKVKTAERCRKLKEKISEAEKEISKSYYSYKINKENEAINKMKENKKYFSHM